MPALEVAGQDVAGPLSLRQPIVIIERLRARLLKVQPPRFLFDDECRRPEEVDESPFIAGQVAHPLFIGGDLASANAETVEKLVVESLGLALLVARLLMSFGKGGGTRSDFGPLETHYPQLSWSSGAKQWRSAAAADIVAV